MRSSDYVLALGMLLTGSVNTITTKFADLQYAVGIDGSYRVFNHPFFQAAGMFFGEFMCAAVFRATVWNAKRKGRPSPDRSRPYSPAIFLLPALCDMMGTSLMYLGLTLTDASVFQMLRGSVVVFTGILSVLFLKRRLQVFQWSAILLVVIGTFMVGYASITSKASSARDPVLGAALVVIAQMVTALQMVVEEKFVSGYDIGALAAVGWEGTWGSAVLPVILLAMYFVPSEAGPNDSFENSQDAWQQMSNSTALFLAVLGNMLSIACFNYFGISVTKAMSASHRMVLDTLRTIIIWAFSLAVKWEDSVSVLQVAGFLVVVLGTMVYNEVVRVRFLFRYESEEVGSELFFTPPGAQSRPWWKRWVRRPKEGEASVEDSFTPHLSRWNTKR